MGNQASYFRTAKIPTRLPENLLLGGSVRMAREFHACLVRYFVRLEKLDDKWRELSERTVRPLEALANRTEQLRHVMNEEDAEDSVDKETRERLIFKILMGLGEEIALLSDILTQLNDANQDLKNYLTNLENARSKVSLKDETMRELIKGTPYRPTLELLLQWAVEGFQFFHNTYLRINDCIKSIDYKAKDTVDNLISSFAEEKRGRKNINSRDSRFYAISNSGDPTLARRRYTDPVKTKELKRMKLS